MKLSISLLPLFFSTQLFAVETRYTDFESAVLGRVTNNLLEAANLKSAGTIATIDGEDVEMTASAPFLGVSPETLRDLLRRSDCELERSGPCLIVEHGNVFVVGLRRASDGRNEFVQGFFQQLPTSRSTTLEELSRSANWLVRQTVGRPTTVFSTAIPENVKPLPALPISMGNYPTSLLPQQARIQSGSSSGSSNSRRTTSTGTASSSDLGAPGRMAPIIVEATRIREPATTAAPTPPPATPAPAPQVSPLRTAPPPPPPPPLTESRPLSNGGMVVPISPQVAVAPTMARLKTCIYLVFGPEGRAGEKVEIPASGTLIIKDHPKAPQFVIRANAVATKKADGKYESPVRVENTTTKDFAVDDNPVITHVGSSSNAVLESQGYTVKVDCTGP